MDDTTRANSAIALQAAPDQLRRAKRRNYAWLPTRNLCTHRRVHKAGHYDIDRDALRREPGA